MWIAYDVPGGGDRLRFGYDGFRRGGALAQSTSSTITADLIALASGDLDVG